MAVSNEYTEAFRAFAVLYRNNVPVRRLKYLSISIDAGLNEARESRVILAPDEIMDFELGDKVEIFTAHCTYGTFYVTQWRVDSSDSEQERSIFLSDCMYLLRVVGVSGSTIFQNDSLAQILALIPNYVVQETGDTLWISQVNPSTFEFTGRLDTDANNLLELLRSVVIASGNAMRSTSSVLSCGLEVGMFGSDTSIVFVDGEDSQKLGNQYQCSQISRDVDMSEQFSAVYCEGGTYRYLNQDWTLLMGQRIPPVFTSDAPAGFTLDVVNRFGIEYFRLSRNGYKLRTKRIQVAGLSPIIGENPSVSVIEDASQTLVNIAARYLEKKSLPMEEITCVIPYPACNLPLGDRALVKSIDQNTAQFVVDDMYYIVSYKIEFSEDSAVTQVKLSNVLFDPEDLTNASINKSADGASNFAPNVAYKTVSGSATVIAGGTVCQTTGRQTNVNIASEMFKSTPVITLTPPAGYTASVTASSATNFTVCVVPIGAAVWPQTVQYSIVGVI